METIKFYSIEKTYPSLWKALKDYWSNEVASVHFKCITNYNFTYDLDKLKKVDSFLSTIIDDYDKLLLAIYGDPDDEDSVLDQDTFEVFEEFGGFGESDENSIFSNYVREEKPKAKKVAAKKKAKK